MMGDQEYIRKAIELADGWHVTERAISIADSRYFCDALAAQLVRQVDATEHTVTVTEQYSEISTWQGDAYGCHEQVRDLGRTMNTIKVIVDSKVLGSAK